jgi:hypothetical protein
MYYGDIEPSDAIRKLLYSMRAVQGLHSLLEHDDFYTAIDDDDLKNAYKTAFILYRESRMNIEALFNINEDDYAEFIGKEEDKAE